MSLDINDPEVERLAREVAEAAGETEVQALRNSLKERLERVRPEPKVAPGPVDPAEAQRRYEDIMEFARRWRALPVDDPRPFDEIVAYDDEGLPR
jgi:antitoxin VapB